jgi:glutaredoxin
MAVPTVIIYSLTTCGWSAKAKAFFRERGVSPYVIEYDMAGADLQRKIAAEMRQHGAQGFPFVIIDGHVVAGYSPQDYERWLKVASSSTTRRA